MLKNERVVLRRVRESDKADMTRLLNNKKVWDNLRDIIPFPYLEDHAKFFINLVKKEEPPSTFVIEYDGQFCGIISLIGQPDVYRQTAHIGYWLGEPFWGKGIATETVKLITEYGFTQLGYARIETGVYAFNKASMRVLEKNGYKKDGVFEKAVTKNDKLWDEHRFSKIR